MLASLSKYCCYGQLFYGDERNLNQKENLFYLKQKSGKSNTNLRRNTSRKYRELRTHKYGEKGEKEEKVKILVSKGKEKNRKVASEGPFQGRRLYWIPLFALRNYRQSKNESMDTCLRKIITKGLIGKHLERTQQYLPSLVRLFREGKSMRQIVDS